MMLLESNLRHLRAQQRHVKMIPPIQKIQFLYYKIIMIKKMTVRIIQTVIFPFFVGRTTPYNFIQVLNFCFITGLRFLPVQDILLLFPKIFRKRILQILRRLYVPGFRQ